MAISDYTIQPGDTPQSVERRRRIAQALAEKGMDASPIRSPWQGAARIAQGLIGGYQMGDTDKTEAAGQQAYQSKLAQALAGGDTKQMIGMIADPWAPPGAAQAIGMFNSNQNQAAQLAESKRQFDLNYQLAKDKAGDNEIAISTTGEDGLPRAGIYNKSTKAIQWLNPPTGQSGGGSGQGMVLPGGIPVPAPVPGQLPIDVPTARKAASEAFVKGAQTAPDQLQQMRDTIELSNQLLTHPGRAMAQGWFAGQLPPVGPGRDWVTRLDQLKGGAFLQARQALKGDPQISNVEGAKAEAAVARMNRATSDAEFESAVKDYTSALDAGMKKLSKKYGLQIPDTTVTPLKGARSGDPVEEEMRRRGLLK